MTTIQKRRFFDSPCSLIFHKDGGSPSRHFFASLTPFAANAQLAVLYFPGVLDMTKQKVAVGEENDRVGGCRGRRLNGFLGLSLNDRTIVFLVILLDKTVSVG